MDRFLTAVKRELAARAGPLPSLDHNSAEPKKQVDRVTVKIAELEDAATRAVPDALVAHVITWSHKLQRCHMEHEDRFIDDRPSSPTAGELLSFKDAFLASRCLELVIGRIVTAKDCSNSEFLTRMFQQGALPQLLGQCLLGPTSVHTALAQTLQDVAPRAKGRQLAQVLRGAILDIARTITVHPEQPRLEQRAQELSEKYSGLRSNISAPLAENPAFATTICDGTEQPHPPKHNEDETQDVEGLLTVSRKVASMMELGDELRRVQMQLLSVRTPNMDNVQITYEATARDMETLSYCLVDSRKAAQAKLEIVHKMRESSINERDEALTEMEKLEQIVLKEEHRLIDHATDLRMQLRVTKYAIIELEKQRRQLEEDRMLTARKYEAQLRKLQWMEHNLSVFSKLKLGDQEAVRSVNALAEWCRPVLSEEKERADQSMTQSSRSTSVDESLALSEWLLDKATVVLQDVASGAKQPVKPARLKELENATKQIVEQMERLLLRYDDRGGEVADIDSARIAASSEAVRQALADATIACQQVEAAADPSPSGKSGNQNIVVISAPPPIISTTARPSEDKGAD